MMAAILAWIADHLLWLVLVIAAVSLLVPGPGSGFSWAVAPVLALMVFLVSLTIGFSDLRRAARQPLVIAWGLILQFVLMAVFSLLLARLLFPAHPAIANGQLLLGALPADISAPLMVSLAGGDTALGMGMLVSAMVLVPFVLPPVLSLIGGISLPVPAGYLEAELFGIIIIPLVAGILANHYCAAIRKNRDAWPGLAALCYLVLLFAVISANAGSILSLGAFALVLVIAELSLNFFGYGLAYLTKRIFSLSRETFFPLLFVAGTKEFGIAPAAADAMGLARATVIPSVFYAVVQMISCPLMVKAKEYLGAEQCPEDPAVLVKENG